MNQADCRTYVRELLTEKNTTVVSNTILDLFIDSGLHATNRRLAYHHTDDATTITLVAGTQEYSLPTDFIDMVWVEWNATKLKKSSVKEWETNAVDWRNTTAAPPTEWAVYGNKLIFYPKPSAGAVASDSTPTFRYVSTATMDASAGPLQLATQDHRLPLYYAACEFSIVHPDSEAAFKRAEGLLGLFEGECAKVAEYYRRRRLALPEDR